jgi:hypothetical protein
VNALLSPHRRIICVAWPVGFGQSLGRRSTRRSARQAVRIVDLQVLWPVLIPLGSFYNSLQSGEIDLPWASIAGFVDVMAIMFAAVWFAHRRERRRDGRATAGETAAAHRPDVRLTR